MDEAIGTVIDATEQLIDGPVATYTSFVSASTYLFLGLVFLVCPVALAIYLGRFNAGKKWLAKMLGREGGEGSRRGRYEMVNKSHA